MTGWLQPSEIFEFPAVEYIPIPIDTLVSGRVPSVEPAGVTLADLKDAGHAERVLTRLNLALVPGREPNFRDNLVFLSLNADVEQCHYRAYQTLMVGQIRPGTCQVFQVTKRYFYKDNFQVSLYDRRARPLAAINVRLRQPCF